MPDTLPIQAVYPALCEALSENNRVILRAPPGAGKSTGVPLELLKLPLFANKKILLLEPRRLAAKAVAQRLAQSLGETVGDTVGYRMRLDTRVGSGTRVEVVTEGILTRMVQSDPELESIACVIFDEFHERSLQADLGLALCLDIQNNLREDLRLLVMSATLDTSQLGEMMGSPPLITSKGRQFPVDVRYFPKLVGKPDTALLARVIKQALDETTGSMLVFLPGVGEIKRTQGLLDGQLPADVLVTPLYGGLENRQQDEAIQPAPEGKRKIVLSTAIAETSLTIEGITVVVDMGLERCSVFSPGSGMSSLITRAASKASAEQRAGRAGRLEAGSCYRLWSESEHVTRRAFSSAEILEADLCSLVLELAKWGVHIAGDLIWVDTPPTSLMSQAVDLLKWLDALDASNRLTEHGKAMSALSVHPRLAHMMVTAARFSSAQLACEVAAALEERAPRSVMSSKDFLDRLRLLSSERVQGNDRGWVTRVRKQSRNYRRNIKETGRADPLNAAQLLGLAFPDRIGQRRGKKGLSYRLSGGGAAAFHEADAFIASEYIVVPELDGRSRDSRIYSAVSIDASEIHQVMKERLETRTSIQWDEKNDAVVAEKQLCLGALVLERQELKNADPDKVRAEIINQVQKRGLAIFDDFNKASIWQARVELLRKADGDASDFPNVREEVLLERLDQWLSPWLDGVRRLSQLRKVSLLTALDSMLDWPLQQRLTQEAPTHFQVPSGSKLALNYVLDEVPILPVRIQELFSSTETPSIARGRVKLVLHLLSPARRPIQITQDLVSFWRNGYPEVKKELKGRYPKHHWPDDPLNTEPHRTVRPRK